MQTVRAQLVEKSGFSTLQRHGSELMENKRAQLRGERHEPFWNSVGLTVLGLSQEVGRTGL